MKDSGEPVLLDPGNPYDFRAEELEQLAQELRTELPNVEFAPIFRPEDGYGGALSEVLYVWLTISGGVSSTVATALIVKRCIAWLKRRWQVDHEINAERSRPRILTLFDGNDQVIRSVRIDLPDGDPVEETPEWDWPPHDRPKWPLTDE